MSPCPILALLALSTLPAQTPRGEGRRPLDEGPRFAAQLDTWLSESLELLGTVPAIAVTVVVDGEVVVADAWGMADLERQVPAGAETQFYIASVTKSFTALMAAELDRHGEIELEAPLAEYLGELELDPALEADTVVLRELLTHTSGIDNSPIAFRLAYSGEHDPAVLWSLLARSTPAQGAPRGTYQYTNVGYNVLGMIVDRETGVRWQDHLRELIFEPLGMERTTAYASLGRSADWPVAAPYFGPHPDGPQRLPLEKRDNTMQSAGGLLTTPNDLGRWLAFQLGAGAIGGERLFDEELIRMTQLPLEEVPENDRPPFGQTAYGFGWSHGAYRDHPVLSHGGGFPGFRSIVSFMPDAGLGVAVLVNEASTGALVLEDTLRYAYDWWLAATDAPDAASLERWVADSEAVRARTAATLETLAAREWTLSRPLEQYTGTFVNELYGTIEIRLVDDRLEVVQGNLRSFAEPHEQPDSIRVELIPMQGNVLEMQLGPERADGLRMRNELFERQS